MTKKNKTKINKTNFKSPLGVGGFQGIGVLFKSAFRSLLGNGLKTWLNVFVLSISFVLIIFMQALLDGWSRQAVTDAIAWEIADGQYWSEGYDPYDPFSLDSSAKAIPTALKNEFDTHQIEPILITQGTIYPEGRMQGILIKGIRPEQKLVNLPTHLLKSEGPEIPVIIGTHLAKQAHLKENDIVTLRWRDVNGTFEAVDIVIAGVFKTTVPTVDNGQIWISLEILQQMMVQPNFATLMLKSPEFSHKNIDGWAFKDVTELTKQTIAMVEAKSAGMSIFYGIFLLLALIAIFDTQTLSIFRRQREIGTFVAIGMTQRQVVGLFTLEGTMNAVLAIVLGTVYGLPLFIYFGINGIPLPMDVSEFGIPVADAMFPFFTTKLIVGTIIFTIVITALVSYLPARKIAKMNPTDAIRAKMK